MSFKSVISMSIASLLLCGCASNAVNPKQTSEIKTQIAVEYIKIGNVDSAKNALDEALKKNPNNALANMTMGVTYQLVGTPSSLLKADDFFKKAIDLEPKNPQIRNNYGQYLFVMERYEDAIEQFSNAADSIGYISRDSSLNNLGQSYLKLSNYEEARQHFLRALQINQRHAEALFGLAETYYQTKNFDDATEVFQDYIELIGKERLDSKGLWLGIRIDHINNDMISMREMAEELANKYPKSLEYRKYLTQKDSSKIWN